MEIGSKLKKARMKTKLTQEHVAEQIGVTRQTISNWENNKSYPDIISVIHLSDLYSISLDELLKGDKKMMEHLDNSTNEIKSRQKFSKLIHIMVYLILWASCLIWFWTDSGEEAGFAMAFSLATFYLILPITTFVISLDIGKDDSWGKYRWLMVFFFGAMYSLEAFGTVSMANTISFGKPHVPTLENALPGIVVSALGMGIGVIVRIVINYRKKYDL